jgi:hypothetical protein
MVKKTLVHRFPVIESSIHSEQRQGRWEQGDGTVGWLEHRTTRFRDTLHPHL